MNAVLTVARASVTEHLRRKLILFFAVFAVFGTAGSVYLVMHREAGTTVTEAAVGLGTLASLGLLSFTATLAAVAVSMNNVGRPFSDGEAMLILSRPLTRRQYAIGRLAGSITVVLGLCAFSAVLMQAVGLLNHSGLNARIWGHWGTTAFNLMALVAMTTLMSSLVNSPVLAGLISYFVYSFSTAAEALYLLVTTGRVHGLPAAIFTAGWYLTPKTLASPLMSARLSGPGAAAMPASPLPGTALRVIWTLAYIVVAVALTFAVVERKDL